MWHCGIDKSAWEAHTQSSYNAVAHIGCGAKYAPFVIGNAIVCEIGANGCEYFIMVDLIPDVLDQEIKKAQASLEQACLLITPNELKKNFPTFPRRTTLSMGFLALASVASLWLKQSGKVAAARQQSLVDPRVRDQREGSWGWWRLW